MTFMKGYKKWAQKFYSGQLNESGNVEVLNQSERKAAKLSDKGDVARGLLGEKKKWLNGRHLYQTR